MGKAAVIGGVLFAGAAVVLILFAAGVFSSSEEPKQPTMPSMPGTPSMPNQPVDVMPVGPPPPAMLGVPSREYGTSKGPWAGKPFTFSCNENGDDFVSEINGFAGKYVNGINVACNSGKTHVLAGTSADTRFSMKGPFTQVAGHSGWGLNRIGTGGKPEGNPWEFKCPPGQKIRKIQGHAGKYIGGVGFVCN